MATKQFDARTLILVFENGVNAKGDPVLVRKSINTLTEEATIDQVHIVGTKLAALYGYPLNSICIDEDFILA
ncbi:MAG: hypothetical protein K0Q49_774 [Haloplasmataceae bacterium]|jgi:hypothetical protein|nr:hypothetical protein [Haloplasmataceae bacterium]